MASQGASGALQQSRRRSSAASNAAGRRTSTGSAAGKKSSFAKAGAAMLGVMNFKKNAVNAAEAKKAEEGLKTMDAVDYRLRLKALSVFRELSEHCIETHASSIAKRLWDSQLEVRQHAAEILGRFPSIAKPHADALAERMGCTDPTTVKRAAHTLSTMGEAGHKALVERLHGFTAKIARLEDNCPVIPITDDEKAAAAAIDKLNRFRRETIEALALCGSTAGEHAGAITDLLSDRDPEIRLCALRCLGDFGEPAAAYVPTIARGLECPDQEFREATAETMGKIGGASAPYAEGLARQIHPAYWDGGAALRSVEDKLKDPPPRFVASASLKLMRDAGADALADQLHHDDNRVRATAVQALGQMPDHASVYAADLSEKLIEPDPIMRARAAEALGNIGRDALLHLPQLAALLWDSDSGVRAVAGQALKKVSKASGLEYNMLMHALANGEMHMIRQAAAENELFVRPKGKDRIGIHKEYDDHGDATYELRVNPQKEEVANWFVPVP